jgi:hypothetical protein
MQSAETVAFVWRCGRCQTVYDAAGLELLLADGPEHRRCACGGELMEGVGAESGCSGPTLPEYLRGTGVQHDLEELSDAYGMPAADPGGGRGRGAFPRLR